MVNDILKEVAICSARKYHRTLIQNWWNNKSLEVFFSENDTKNEKQEA